MSENTTVATPAAPAAGESQTQNEPAKAAPTETPAAAEQKKTEEVVRKYKLKINGQDREVDEKFLVTHAQKGLAADEKFQKTAVERKNMEKLIKLAKEDPDRVIRELTGEEADEVYKRRLAAKLEKLSMTPEQRELAEYKEKLAAYEKKEAEKKAEETKAREEKAVQFWVQQYDKEIPEAIKAAGLPVDTDIIKSTTEVMLAALEDGIDMPMSVVMDIVKDKYKTSLKGFVKKSEKTALLDLLDDEDVEGLIKAREAKKSAKKPAQAVQTQSRPYADPKVVSQDEWNERIERWKKGE